MRFVGVSVLLFCASAYASECRKCNGSGKLICPTCSGAGSLMIADNWNICHRCDGPRRLATFEWRNGRKHILLKQEQYWYGSGVVFCNICRGKGYRGRKSVEKKAGRKKLSARDRAALLQGFADLAKGSPSTADAPAAPTATQDEAFDWSVVYYPAGGLGLIVLLVLIRRALN